MAIRIYVGEFHIGHEFPGVTRYDVKDYLIRGFAGTNVCQYLSWLILYHYKTMYNEFNGKRSVPAAAGILMLIAGISMFLAHRRFTHVPGCQKRCCVPPPYLTFPLPDSGRWVRRQQFDGFCWR